MSDYAGPILGAVGAVVGFVYGGPTGAYWGWAIGSAVGGMYAASQQVLPGPKIGDMQKQTSQEGGFRAIIFGRSHPIMGNVIADSEPVIVKKEESQGKGGPKVETEYAYRTYAVGFCEGETTLLQAWRNGILVYDVEDPSMEPENAKFLEYATWYTGSFDQMPAPDLEAIYGVNNTPFFRGTSYLVLASEDVTDQRGAWSQWQVRVFRGASKRVTSPPYPAELVDDLATVAAVNDGDMRDLLWQASAADPITVGAAVISGELRTIRKDLVTPREEITANATVSAGELRTIRKDLAAPREEIAVTAGVASGSLTTSRLDLVPPHESLTTTATVNAAGGYLGAP